MNVEEVYKQRVLIADEYIIEYSPLPKNYDLTDIRPFINIAEAVHIVPIIGQAQYEELLNQIEDNNLTDVNSTLLLKIYPLEAMCIVSEALPFIWTSLADKGVTLGKSDNSDSISAKDLNMVQNHITAQISVLKTQLKDWLKLHQDCFPLIGFDECSCKPKSVGSVRLYPNSFCNGSFNL